MQVSRSGIQLMRDLKSWAFIDLIKCSQENTNDIFIAFITLINVPILAGQVVRKITFIHCKI